MKDASSYHSIANQIFRSVFGLYCLIAVTVTSVQIVEEYRYTQKTILEELESFQKIFGPVLAKALWNLDRTQIKDILEGMNNVPAITDIEIQQLQGSEHLPYISTFSTIKLKENDDQFSYEFPIKYEIFDSHQILGKAILYSDSSVVLGRVQLGFIFLIVNAIIKGVALWFIYWWVCNKQLVRPLRNLISVVSNVKFDNLSAFKMDKCTKENNEIKLLEDEFSSMVFELSKARKHVVDFNSRLDTEITQRTAQLLKAKVVAENAAASKTDFLAKMSHELRTPMNGIQGMLYLLEQSDLNEKQYKNLRTAKSSSDRLLIMIDQLLKFSEIEDGSVEIENINFYLHDFLKDTINCATDNANNPTVKTIANISIPEGFRAIGDPIILKQILLGMLSNAFKFTSEGEVYVNAEIEIDHENDGLHLEITVADTGIGIEENELKRIFDPFTQADERTTRQYDGSGLGLAIVKRLCELMQGSIQVSSRVGLGTTFIGRVKLQHGINT